ncbi:hypothetical protein J2Z42_000507 [Clostridium algifaecis]|uniref:Uncharacterized protein n=1 Tax=Clostridium algifaecis TaxID=1472040 RepID=A0ABS4KP70_9CLOT|nr:hypothetical protein [Clostridium algifaecis]MBP2031842.1 hypothetical protein [Clostridium algifaecis]
MYDVKIVEELQKNKNTLRADCICDRSYFKQIQYYSMFELKSIHIPTENLIK